MIGADKFDNILVARVPEECSNAGLDAVDASGLRLQSDTTYITGQTPKLEHVASFHVGETITAIEKTPLVLGGHECLVHSSLMGGIAVLYPVTNPDEVEFLKVLEMGMRSERPPLCGREHMSFRSAFHPVSRVVDGDLCEQFTLLSEGEQQTVADACDKTRMEVVKKLEDIRNRIL